MPIHFIEPFPWRFCAVCGNALILTDDGEKPRPFCSSCQRFYYHNPTPATCCFVTRTGKDLLLTKRAIYPAFGQWTLPGGYMELGETTEESAVRELYEETGLVAEQIQLLGISAQPSQQTGTILVLGFVVNRWKGEIKAGSDVSEAQFFLHDQLPQLAFTAHRELLNLYIQSL
ncbi:MAG: NUDIX domain-containing protein [Candidatus Hydrogenedens sp.]|nr:NUDIX domain-containing protein [Candidatus Hydrogenedens sp.]